MQNTINIQKLKSEIWQPQFLPAKDGNFVGQTRQDDSAFLQEDTITISEDAKKLAIHKKNETGGNIQTDDEAQNSATGEMSGADQTIQKLREQIQEIQEKIQDAQQRLIQAQASDTPNENKVADPDEAILQKTMKTLAGSTEVESIRAEIEMLNQQLLMLNDQLKEAMRGAA